MTLLSEAPFRPTIIDDESARGCQFFGLTFGATDEMGMSAVEDLVNIHDIHATLLHQLGVDHEKLTFRFGGRDMRLTDVHGQVITGILA